MTDKSARQTITTVERAADVLSAFARAENQTLGVTEIAQELSISKAVVHRILNSLRGKRFIEVDSETRRYMLGPNALALGLAFLRHVDVRDLARPVLRDLSEKTQETATLSIRTGWHRMYVDQVTPAREVKMTVSLGQSFPLHAGSSSKAILAYIAQDDIDDYLSTVDLEPLTELTITDPAQLLDELAKIRADGFAMSRGERQSGAGSVAAPILDHTGRPIASMSLCGPVERFLASADEAATLVVGACQRLSQQLGYRPAAS